MEVMNRSIGDKMFVISEHVPILVGFSWGSDHYKDYFDTDRIKDCFNDLLDREQK